jgi:hypothetical protein
MGEDAANNTSDQVEKTIQREGNEKWVNFIEQVQFNAMCNALLFFIYYYYY